MDRYNDESNCIGRNIVAEELEAFFRERMRSGATITGTFVIEICDGIYKEVKVSFQRSRRLR